MFSARVGKRQLAALCRRLATSLEAGLDIRRIMTREAEGRGSPALRSRLAEIDRQVAAGVSIHEAVAATGDYFPPLFREMIAVGEATGKQAEIFRHLADHYDHQLAVRRVFLTALALPLLQLGATILIIAVLIWALGAIASYSNSKPIDILGFGLYGTQGLIKYFAFLATLSAIGVFIWQAIQRGWLWGRIVERILLRVPFIGGALRVLAMERLAWSLRLTLDTNMETRQAIDLSLRSTQNGVYRDAGPDINREVASGRSLTEAFERTHVFPDDFLEALDIGERSGRIPESMEHLAQQYQDKGRLAIRALSVLGWVVTFMVIAGVIISLIFKLAFFYVGTINEFAKPI
ncbi:MAG: type II secretion system F family protein [Planctomycetia bacterium]|mgnify:CR=1 FL=1|nr:type II secretion system F family protein [Planctomycetia bacterium]